MKEFREALDFIDHHDAVFWTKLLRDAPHVSAQGKINRGLKQVVSPGSLQGVANEEALSGLPRAEEEVRLLFKQGRQVEEAFDVRGILRQYLFSRLRERRG